MVRDPTLVFFSEEDYKSDMASINCFFEASTANHQMNQISFFTKNPEDVYVDNFANTHISNNRKHYITFTSIPKESGGMVSTVGGNAFP